MPILLGFQKIVPSSHGKLSRNPQILALYAIFKLRELLILLISTLLDQRIGMNRGL